MAKAALEAELTRINALAVEVPGDLRSRVVAYLEATRTVTWDDAVREIMEEDEER